MKDDICDRIPDFRPDLRLIPYFSLHEYEGLLFSDVFEVDRGDDGDARRQQLFDVLVAVGVAAPGRVLVRQSVDQTNLGMALEQGGEVDDGDAGDFERRILFNLARQIFAESDQR